MEIRDGSDLDYWVGDDAVEALAATDHRAIVDQLVDSEGLRTDDIKFAALKSREAARAPGLAAVLQGSYGLQQIETPMGEPYGIAKDGLPLHVYVSDLHSV